MTPPTHDGWDPPLTLRDRLRNLRYTLLFEWRHYTRCRHFWFSTAQTDRGQLHICEGWRGHGGLHYHDGVTDDGTGGK